MTANGQNSKSNSKKQALDNLKAKKEAFRKNRMSNEQKANAGIPTYKEFFPAYQQNTALIQNQIKNANARITGLSAQVNTLETERVALLEAQVQQLFQAVGGVQQTLSEIIMVMDIDDEVSDPNVLENESESIPDVIPDEIPTAMPLPEEEEPITE